MKKPLLRTVALFVICNLSFVIGKAQWVSIPDTAFGDWLNTHSYSQCLQGSHTTGWQMDTTCNAIISATKISCGYSSLHNLAGIQYFDNLDTLDCSSNFSLATILSLPNSLRYLKMRSTAITTLPPLPVGLTYLDCSYSTSLTTITALPDSLLFLNTFSCPISTLSYLPSKLVNFNCGGSNLLSLPALPNSLISLYCNDSHLINGLPALPNSLSDLICYNDTSITTLPALPNSLLNLDCTNNRLTNLPSLPTSLKTLKCIQNKLTILPTLPGSLKQLFCSQNLLSTLPNLPDSLRNCNCSENLITQLPTLPNSLRSLNVAMNLLSILPALPSSLTSIDCYDNQLSSLPALPDSLDELWCYNNPIACLPFLHKIIDFRFYNTLITCLPNLPQSNTSSYPLIDTIPVCDINNSNSCFSYLNISGNVFSDVNNNCIKDSNEVVLRNIPVKILSNGVLQQETISNSFGFYNFHLDSFGTYSLVVDTTQNPFYVSCPSNGVQTAQITALDSVQTIKDFAIGCKNGFDLVAQSFTGRFRPGQTHALNITAGDFSNFYNGHCVSGLSGTVQLIVNGAGHYASVASGGLTPSSVANDTITWNIADFGTINFFSAFNCNIAVDTTAHLGSQVCLTLIVNPIAGDNNQANNIFTHCFPVQTSWDPNEKEVYPAGNIDTATHWLTYTIHFQNTGTDTAFDIYVTDTLDSNIDAGSFQLLAYSHQPNVFIKGSNVRFNFPNINLPDSNTNEPLSHGYVQYRVKLKDNLPIGTHINNTAFIYFDFNSPVVTNTTSNTITTATSIKAVSRQPLDVSIYPNPASESVTISVDESLIGSTLTISDVTGRVIINEKLNMINTSLYLADLSSGVYLVSVANEKGKMTKKLVKQ